MRGRPATPTRRPPPVAPRDLPGWGGDDGDRLPSYQETADEGRSPTYRAAGEDLGINGGAARSRQLGGVEEEDGRPTYRAAVEESGDGARRVSVEDDGRPTYEAAVEAGERPPFQATVEAYGPAPNQGSPRSYVASEYTGAAPVDVTNTTRVAVDVPKPFGQ